MRVLEKSLENPRISDEISAMFPTRILESLEKNREMIKCESWKNYDENPKNNPKTYLMSIQ